MFYKVDGQPNNATVLYSDVLASNGMIHIIDKIMWNPGTYSSSVSVRIHLYVPSAKPV